MAAKISEKMTVDRFYEILTKKYGKKNLTQSNIKEKYTNVPLILVYFEDKTYIRPKKHAKNMTMEELRAAAESIKHVGTYNKKEGTGFIF